MPQTTRPISYGQRLLPQVLDETAISSPERLYASFPHTANIADGFRDVTFKDMANAVNSFSHLLHKSIGRGVNFETLCFLGVPDLRTAIVCLASWKCGYKVLVPSPRNPPATNLSLMQQTNCTKIFYAAELGPLVKGLHMMNEGLQCSQVLSLQEMLNDEASHYPFDDTFDEAVRKPILVIHSSGSTGIPKPIVMTHGTLATIDDSQNLAEVPGRKRHDFTLWNFKNGVGRIYSVFPPFHLGGIIATIVIPIYSDAAAPVLGPPLRPPNGFMVSEIMKQQDLRGLFITPSIAEQLLQEPAGIDYFKRLSFLCYAGGPLSDQAGDQLARVLDICQFYGSTEALSPPQLVAQSEDWAYMEWHPDFKCEMQPSDDDAFEMVLFPDASTERSSALNHNFPHIREYRTKDLFKPHPTKKNLWRFYGRRDDIIVLSSGEKFNPASAELMIQSHPSLSGALIAGQGRPQAILLVEPEADVDRSTLPDQIWLVVEQANHELSGPARIARSKMLIASPGKPFVRAGKGTVVRRLTEDLYATEIQAMYTQAESLSMNNIPFLEATYEADAVRKFVRDSIATILPQTQFSDDDDLFKYGLDSLKCIEVLNGLKAGLKRTQKSSEPSWLTTKFLYSNPTISQMSEAIQEFLNAGIIRKDERELSHATQMESLVREFTKDLPRPPPSQRQAVWQPSVKIALTGVTGSLGRCLLKVLAKDRRISKIYCLTRAPDTERLPQEERKKHDTGADSKISEFQYLQIRLEKPRWGLNDAAYAEVQATDVIVHAAWTVDFNLALKSFADHLHGIRHLVELSNTSTRKPRLVFLSSVSSVGNWPSNEGGAVPEDIISDYDAPLPMGYAESKFVAEQILATAAQKAGVPVSILRIGQIAGSTRPDGGIWPTQEWVPSLVKTSKAIGLVPNDLPPVDWIPIDLLARIIQELAFADTGNSNFQVYNLVNPHLAPWSSLVNSLYKYCGAKAIPLTEWLQVLGHCNAMDITEVEAKPALKMLAFFETMPQTPVRFATDRAAKASEVIAALEPINQTWIEHWLKEWDS